MGIMRRFVGAILVAGGTASAIMFSPPSWSADMSEYLNGDRTVVYGQTIVLETCANVGPPSFRIPLKLFAKEGGKWTPVSTAKISKSKKCRSKKFPFMHEYKWDVDVLGRKSSPLRYDLELAFGASPSKSRKFIVTQFANSDALEEYYACRLIYGFDPAAVDKNC